jgi:hypothetical protein
LTRASGTTRGLLLAAALAAAALAHQARLHDDPHVVHTRFDLPAFDPWVYVAMADHLAFFTVAPWGYRILTPWVVAALPGRDVVGGFRAVTLAGLALSAFLVFVYLRRLGHGEIASLAGVAVYGLSGPVSEAVANPFLAEPVTAALQMTWLVALEAGAGPGLLGFLATLGCLSKESFLLLVPLAFLVRRGRDGNRRALVLTVAAALPALAALVALRLWWTPHIRPPLPEPSLGLLGLAWVRLAESWRDWWPATLLYGLAPLALLGALRRAARGRLAAWTYLVFVAFVPPFFNPVTFFSGDIPRLLLYALPAVIPLALLAVDRVIPHVHAPAPTRPQRRGVEPAAAVAAVLLALLACARVDRYRRLDLQGPRDGPFVVALCRESLRTANRLERGETVSYDPQRFRWVWGESDPGRLGRMRWFLLDGWGPLPQYETRDVFLMRADRATLVLPCFRPRDLEMTLVTEAPGEMRLEVLVNDRPVGSVTATTLPAPTVFIVKAESLLRGDNRVTIVAPSGEAPFLKVREARFRAVGP